jgi:hypothetical protein
MSINQFAIIDVEAHTVHLIEDENISAAYDVAGLKSARVDHGMVHPATDDRDGLGIVVEEFGFFVPRDEQGYFEVGGRLYAGNAVLYGFRKGGATASIEKAPAVHFFSDAGEVEAAIADGRIERPAMRINGSLVWQWPQPRPSFLTRD